MRVGLLEFLIDTLTIEKFEFDLKFELDITYFTYELDYSSVMCLKDDFLI